MSSSDFVQMLAAGLASGSIYMLMANGLFITHLTTGTLHFGQGDFLMIAAFVAMALMTAGVAALVAVVVTLVILGALGVLLERVAIRPLERKEGREGGILAWILTTAGFGLIIQNVATLAWGKSSQYSPPLFGARNQNVVSLGGINFYTEELAITAVAFCVVGALYYFLYRTRYGRSITAVAFNKDVAALLGVNVRAVIVACFAIMAVLAGIAGVLVAPITTVHAHMGLIYTLKGFVVLNIGGFTNPLGVLVAGLAFGIAEAFCNYFDSKFGDLYPFIFIIAFLAVRPTGLFAEARADVR